VNDITKLSLVAQEVYEYLVRKGSDDNGIVRTLLWVWYYLISLQLWKKNSFL